MTSITIAIALVAAAVNAVAGLYGAWRYYRVQPDARFWPLLRAAQVTGGLLALWAGVLAVVGDLPGQNLFLLYALLPVGISFVAEQLRAVSAQTVLDARSIPDAAAVGALPEREQRSVVTAILRREMGVMAASAVVVAFLALRAWGTV